jgi:hypothetical protein
MASQLSGTLHLDIQPAAPHASDGVEIRRQDEGQGDQLSDRNDSNTGTKEHIPDGRQYARCMRTNRTTVRPAPWLYRQHFTNDSKPASATRTRSKVQSGMPKS